MSDSTNPPGCCKLRSITDVSLPTFLFRITFTLTLILGCLLFAVACGSLKPRLGRDRGGLEKHVRRDSAGIPPGSRRDSAGIPQPCNPATLQPCNLTTLYVCNPATLQPCNSATLQPCNPATLQPCNLATLQRCNPATLQPCNPATLQPCNPATSSGYCISLGASFVEPLNRLGIGRAWVGNR